MKDILTFNKFISPYLIKAAFWLSLVIVVILAAHHIMAGTGHIIQALRIVILGPIFSRVACEWLLVQFKSYTTLNSIAKTLEDKQNLNSNHNIK